jgi:predicted N-acyltransferase
LKLTIHEQIGEIPQAAWNRLVRGRHPFLQYEFLHAMELHGCVGEHFGWLPRHLAIHDNGRLVGALPLYEKTNSYGEFVFDHVWADAYRRNGLAYYPKLVSAIPYTPAVGQRLLCEPNRQAEIFPLLLGGALQLTEQIGASGFHCLFPLQEEHHFLSEQNLLTRHDCQFHWKNEGYSGFDDFLDRLTTKKRKNIRQERRKVEEAGIEIRQLDGHLATEEDWHHFTRFYNQTFVEKWGLATFNLPFFLEIAQAMPDQILLVLANQAKECVAGSLMYLSNDTLYGRHWGSIRQIDSLHFEACYYQGISFSIERGLQRFEPGAQGEHKIARGFRPTLTQSSHWLVDARFQQPISKHAALEREAVADYMRNLESSLPFRAGS